MSRPSSRSVRKRPSSSPSSFHWLESRIDEQNQEYEKLNNDRTLFDVEWNNFFDSYIQDHMPLTAAPYFQV